MYIAILQNNPTVGAFAANADALLSQIEELANSPYPPDLVITPACALSGVGLGGMEDYLGAAGALTEALHDFVINAQLPTLVGTLVPNPVGDAEAFNLESDILFCRDSAVSAMGFVDVYDAWDDDAYASAVTFDFADQKITVLLDDLPDDPSEVRESDIVVIATADTYYDADDMLTASEKLQELTALAREAKVWVVNANLAGGNDSEVYSGASVVISPQGVVRAQAKPFAADILLVNLSQSSQSATDGGVVAKPLLPYEADYRAIAQATGDYVRKNGFSDVVLGISGGIDSAVCAAIAVDALGAEHVHGILMPGPYSSAGSVEDAQALTANLGIDTLTLPITQLLESYKQVMLAAIEQEGSALALQNLQARIRANYLMHLSNTYGWLLLNTGNKSEAAMGYSTLYGDTCGAFAPLGNVYKGDVYELATWRNQQGKQVIPQTIIDKEPSAELYAGQRDSDTLPPYELLDKILRLHIEEDLSLHEIVDYFIEDIGEQAVDPGLVASVLATVKAAEFKRRQEPLAPGLALREMSADRDWPYTNGLAERADREITPIDIIRFLEIAYHEKDSSPGGPQSMGIFAN